MALDLVELRVTGALASKKFVSWGREKQNAVSKYPVAVSDQSHRAAYAKKGLTVPSIGTVKAV
ncbi:hypothetical protein [Bradyrhizobium sp. URHC0002]|jgi:hypothetical protein